MIRFLAALTALAAAPAFADTYTATPAGAPESTKIIARETAKTSEGGEA